MRYQPNREADDLRQLILDRPTVPPARLARLYGITIKQVAGYRAAHALRTQRQAADASLRNQVAVFRAAGLGPTLIAKTLHCSRPAVTRAIQMLSARTADELRQLVLDRPTVPVADLARLYGITAQQINGYRAAHTRTTQRQASRPTSPHAVTLIPQPLKAQLHAARTRTEGALKNYLTRALHANALVAKTLKALDRQL